MSISRTFLLAASVAAALGLSAPTAFGAPITFSSDTDYNNAAVQTTGVFRDILLGDGSQSSINRGLDLGGTGRTALNFTGDDNTTSPFGRIAVYDTTPSDSVVKNLFSGDLTLSADILIHATNNGKGAGLLTMFSEGAGKTGLALFLQSAGNTDAYQIRLVQQDGPTSPSLVPALQSVSLGGNIAENQWYRLTMILDFTGADFTITGKVFSHTTGTDPNSALGAQIGATLTYTDTAPWTSGLSDPYEIGLVARGNQATIDTSVTNFCISGCPTAVTLVAVPEPGTTLLMGAGLLGLMGFARKKLKQ